MLYSALLPQTTPFPHGHQLQLPRTQSKIRSYYYQNRFPPRTRPFLPHFLTKYPSGYRKSLLGSSSFDSSAPPSFYDDDGDDFDVELGRLLALLPEEMRRRVSEHPELHQLIEVVMDLGRKPLARFPSGDFVLSDLPIMTEDIQHATSQCRSVLKLMREVARMLANDYKKRVMIVDTSNEIGGDGDIPHAGIGSARRMQVPNSDMQHKVLIEAVENHMPQVIVIDEISTKLEAMAASTIAQRGIQLVATAHGVTIENLIMNPALEMLVGGIQSVTLGDEEASRRGVQKTVLERKGPPTFMCGVEIISKTQLRVHRCLESTVDAILFGRFPNVEVRKMDYLKLNETAERGPFIYNSSDKANEIIVEDAQDLSNEITSLDAFSSEVPPNMGEDCWEERMPLRLFVYGILEASVTQAIKQLKLNDAAIELTENISEADALLALQSKLKKNSRIQAAVKSHNTPIYVTKTSSLVHITKGIRALMTDLKDGLKDFEPVDEMKLSEKLDALEEARIAIEQVVIPKGESIELLPRPSNVMSLQMDLIQKYQLEAERIGTESDVRLRILPHHSRMDEEGKISERDNATGELDDFVSANGDPNGSLYVVDRLPLLPD
ncbi:protein SEEDLING PLASTID DEVELOPMENT 1 isoform X3 [Quercus robur]|uniref:protein SEEDLING PLASTID DEVELOPMENT 1 isoform X3 n=1 Tax=Quercus robur TaxID=38942 RepID=UPI00216202B5|nr:protein SEEDLING PLASTID DEVELOPMENT 1 isoform X3 [Quercus robur]